MLEVFKDIQDFRKYAQGVDGSLNLETLAPSFISAKDKLLNCISKSVYEALLSDANGKEIIKRALAPMTMYGHLVFWSVSTDQKMYKYQHEEMKEWYLKSFWTNMSGILRYLDSNPDIGMWSDNPIFAQRQELIIPTANDFDYYYGIDGSDYFFVKTLFLQRKVINDSILPRIKSFEDLKDSKLKETVRRALCYEIMAEAVMKFDVTELPSSIRNDIAHEFTKSSSQMQAREVLHANLMKDVNKWHMSIENALRKQAGATNNISEVKESDKFYKI